MKNKTVLVTGADGFIGSHLTEELVKQGYSVKAFVYYNSFNTWGWLDTLSKNILDKIEIICGDIRDYNMVKYATQGVDIVFHLAALIAIPYSYVAPESFIQTNINGTLNILQASRENKCKRILITSTSEVYGSALYTPIDELHPLQAQSPYSASKIGADKIAESFYKSFDVPISIVRPFNNFGPRQSARAIIPTLITQLLDNKKEIKLGSLFPIRDFVYVKDTVSGFIKIANSDNTIGEVINIATNNGISIGELANKLISIINPKAKIVIDKTRTRPKNSEVDRLIGCNKKIMKLTSWKQQYSFDKGLLETIEWYKKNKTHFKSNLYNT